MRAEHPEHGNERENSQPELFISPFPFNATSIPMPSDAANCTAMIGVGILKIPVSGSCNITRLSKIAVLTSKARRLHPEFP